MWARGLQHLLVLVLWWSHQMSRVHAALFRLESSVKLLQQLTPTRRLVGAVISDSTLGLSISDPYLSFASPLPLVGLQLRKVLAEFDAEGVVIGLPLLPPDGPALGDEAVQLQRCIDALEHDLSASYSQLPASIFKERLTAVAAIAKYEQDPLWDETGIETDISDADVQSAIMLQQFLDDNCGGWQNTFG
jgi:RNase H-fold protein (predicted Holliday junction resolvase)